MSSDIFYVVYCVSVAAISAVFILIGWRNRPTQKNDDKIGEYVCVLRYAIDATKRISGDHNGNAGLKSPNDSYSKIARDFLMECK